ncbi:MAG TPA: hypothetical protein VM282_02255 [Acidimicrobiales bacterium]|nr:hypothetical protein [Acidimicrobiales bacterium]
MRVVRRFVVCLGACLLLIRAQPAAAGGSWMHGEWDRYELGETVTMVGYFGAGQQGWLDDGPFFAHVRPAVGSEAETSRSALTAPVQFTSKTLSASFGIYHELRVETTFVLPPDLPDGHYNVVVCNTGCKKGIGDLIGGPLAVGVNAQWVIQRNWPKDDPSYARFQAMPPDRRAVGADPTASVGPTVFSPSMVPRHTYIEAEPAIAPAVEASGPATNWAGIVATSAVVIAAGAAGVAVHRRVPAPGRQVLPAR